VGESGNILTSSDGNSVLMFISDEIEGI